MAKPHHVEGLQLKRSCLASIVVALVLLTPLPKAAASPSVHDLRLELNGAALVGGQENRFDVGGGFSVGYEFRFLEILGAELGYRAAFFPGIEGRSGQEGFGASHSILVGLRFHPLPDLRIGDLWVNLRGAAVFTGQLVRGGLSSQIGMDFDLSDFLRIGPFVGFQHTFHPGDAQWGSGDASTINFGVSMALLLVPMGGDEDGDGVRGEADLCPNEQEDNDGFEDGDGCPDPDNDGDGIPDGQDQCPDRAEDINNVEDQDGCPDPDSDNDGSPDALDQCPEQLEDRDGVVDWDGCPEVDGDEDGIPDTEDQCPTEAETLNGRDDQDGCPDQSEAERQLNDLVQQLSFSPGRSQLRGGNAQLLSQIAELLRQHPEWTNIRIDGYPDSDGAPERNLAISEGRARRVRDSLARRGIARSRFTVQGHTEINATILDSDASGQAIHQAIVISIIEANAPTPPSMRPIR